MSSNTDQFGLTAEQYLVHHHIPTYFEDAISEFLEYKEENAKLNPASFLHEYFTSVLHGNHTLFRSFQYVQATPRNRASFIKNFWKSFQHIGRNGDLLNIKEYHSLVCLLCVDFPLDVLHRTARIILIDDAMDCLMSFSDFLYAFQTQFYFQEFIDRCYEIYKAIGNDIQYKMAPESSADTGSIPVEAKSSDDVPQDVNAKRFMEKLSREVFAKKVTSLISCPPESVIKEILLSASRVSFYGLLIALTKSDAINKSIGALPDKRSLIDISDDEASLASPRPQPTRPRNALAKKR